MREGVQRPQLISSVFLLVMLSTFAYFLSVGALLPTLPRYVEGPLNGSNFEVGLVIGSFAIAAVLLRPLIGLVGDRRGRKILVVSGASLVAVSIAGYLFAESILPLILLRLVSGAGEAAFYVGAASTINDLAPDERRGEAFSYFSLALFLGIALGPLLGESSLSLGFDAAWLIAAGAATLAAIVGMFVPETRPDFEEIAPRRLVHRAGLFPGLILSTNIWGLASFTSFVPLYALRLGLSGSKFIFALHSVIVMLIRAFGARIPDALGPSRSSRAALAFASSGFAAIALWESPAGLYTGTILFSLGHSLLFPALMSLAVRSAPPSERASVVSTFTAFFDLSFGLGALSAGAVAGALGYRGAFGAAAVVAFAGFTLLQVRARMRGSTARQTDADAVAVAARE
ncbi:MAG TPA: MFS transporter [Actinomycetota bacterium]|nr:MFS transporter [Actinomycetota bacterium]